MTQRAIVTSALPYANGEIHIGHITSTYLPADVTVRHLRQKGIDAHYVCATDDYGTPILIQSEKEGKSPADYVAEWNRRDAADFASLDIRFDAFSHTSAPECAAFVQDAFRRLSDAGHIYEKEIVQFYCDTDAMFLPDRYVRGTCPHCSSKDQYSDLCESCGNVPDEILEPKCSICGAVPQKKATSHYFFALSKFSDQLRTWLETNANLQSDVKKYVLDWISQGLTDWDITRDISWGVKIPDDADGRVFYGWFDNHLAYISASLHMFEQSGTDGKEFWNSADIYHFIGKDIIYHHYMLLPAVRMGMGGEFKLPDYIPVRGHLTLEGRKISKSRGWYIGIRDFLSHFPADYLRFYLLLTSSYSQDDLNFDWGDFATRINTELIGNIGNFVNRTLSFTAKSFDSRIPERGPDSDMHSEARSRIEALADKTGTLLGQGHLDRALKEILAFSSYFNQYFQHCEPWKDERGAPSCIYMSANAVRSLAISLYAFVPSSAQRMWEQLGYTTEVAAQSWDSLSDMSLEAGRVIPKPTALFAKVDNDVIAKLKGSQNA